MTLHRDTQLARRAIPELGQIAQRGFHLRQGCVRQRQQPTSRCGKPRRSRRPIHQRQAQLLFQTFQLMRHRRLRQVQARRRSREAPAFRHCRQQAQVAQLNMRYIHK